jgi:hypothetical protein
MAILARTEPDESLLEMHEVLHSYINVHNRVFRGRWAGLIPRLFRPMPFHDFVVILKAREENLERTRHLVVEWDPHSIGLEVMLCATNYLDALHATINKLRWMCVALDAKAHGQQYRWKEYRADLAAYRALVDIYRAAGSDLNALIRIPLPLGIPNDHS